MRQRKLAYARVDRIVDRNQDLRNGIMDAVLVFLEIFV